MKTAIAYYSKHHGNTKKMLDAIADNKDVFLLDVTEMKDVNLSEFDLVGFASGIYYSNFAKQVVAYAKEKLPENKKVFLMATCGSKRKNYFDEMKQIVETKNCELLGTYLCNGYDTYGPLKLFGGIHKNHPTIKEIEKGVAFYKKFGGKNDGSCKYDG